MKEVIVRLTGDYIKVKGGEYVRDYEHGEWIEVKAEHNIDKTILDCRKCSVCGAAYVIHNNIRDLDLDPPNFCPNCGASMTEREGE